MSRRALAVLASLVAIACAEDGADDTADTSGDTADTGSDSADTGSDSADTSSDTADTEDDTADTGSASLPTYDAEAPTLTSGGWVDYAKPGDTTRTTPPEGIAVLYGRASVGVFRPTTAHLNVAEPLAGPAGGSQVYFLSVSGGGVSATGTRTANAGDHSEITFTGTDAMVEGKAYSVSWTWAARKDLFFADATGEILVDGVAVGTVTFDPETVGFWYTGGGSYTAQAADAGKPLTVRFSHTTQTMATYQVLIDQVLFQSN